MSVRLAAARSERDRRTRARTLRRHDIANAGRFAPVAWLANLLDRSKEKNP